LFQGEDRTTAERRIALRFAAAWQRGDYGGMFGYLAASERARVGLDTFRRAYTRAAQAATVQGTPVRVVELPQAAARFRPSVAARPRLFGTRRSDMNLHFTGSGKELGIIYRPEMTFPGLRPGERVHRRALPAGTPASILAADGSRLGGVDGGFP